MALDTTHTTRQTDTPSTDGAGAASERTAVPHTSWSGDIFGESLTPQPTSPTAETSAREVVSTSESGARGTAPQPLNVLPPSPEASPPPREATPPSPEAPPASGEVTRERFNAEMSFERRGYRPVEFYSTVEQALASNVDTSKVEVFVDVKKGGFTADEVTAIPDNAKRNNYHLGFARQLFDANEGIFTKGFWTSSEGIKKVLSAGFIKAETEEIHLEAAQWLLSKREVGTAAPTGGKAPTAGEEAEALLASIASPADTRPAVTHDKPQEDTRRFQPPVNPREETPVPPVDEVPVVVDVIPPPTSPTQKSYTRHDRVPPVNVGFPATNDVTPIEAVDNDPGFGILPNRLTSEPESQATPTTPPLRNEPKIFEMADLNPLEARLKERFAALKASIGPRTLTVVVEDNASIDTVIQNLHFYKDFNKAFTEQVSKTQAVLEQVGKLGLDQPSQGGVFKKKQEDALRLIDTLSFSKSDLAMVADKIKVEHGTNLPGSMRDAVKNAEPFLDAIKKELEEARNIIRNARRINPASTVNQPNPEEKSQVLTGSVAAMPRLGKELTVNPKKLESMGHAMVDANVPDQEMNAKYKAIMSEFVKSYVSTFSKVRKEIYEARMDGSNLSSLQKEKFTYLAEELGQQVQVSDLMEIGSSKTGDTTKVGAHFGRIVDGSSFQKKLNQMKEEFSKALMKEIEKTPGTEDTDTTYVAYKRQRYEKSGITDFLKS